METEGHWCREGKHYWLRAQDADLCCNGYRRELRFDALEPGDDPALATRVPGVPAWWVWQEERA